MLGTGVLGYRHARPSLAFLFTESVIRILVLKFGAFVWNSTLSLLAHHNSMVIKSWLCPWKCAGRVTAR